MVPAFPRWVWSWLGLLAFVAGYTNAVALGAWRQPVTHMTGLTTVAALSFATGQMGLALLTGGVILAFVSGAALSGFFIRAPRWTSSVRHGWLFVFEAGCLVTGGALLGTQPSTALITCAFGIGIQNGVATHLSGAVLRTSHVTGMLTDLALAAGQALQGNDWDHRRVRVCGVVVIAFFVGAGGGALGVRHWGGVALDLPALLLACTACFHFTARRFQTLGR